MDRRHFLMGAAASASALRASSLASPNDTVRVACIGVRGKIIDHVKPYLAMKNVEIAAICDVDEEVLDRRIAEVVAAGKKKPARYVDARKVFEDKSIDAVSIATPNHTHTLLTVWACQAGKDVYVEKPCAHNMFEARQIVAAAKKYNRMVQQGTNQRSEPAVREAVEQLRGGLIGDIYMARALCFKWRDTIGRAPVEPVPAGVHYDLWLGPAPKTPFTRNRFHYNFHWMWAYGNGDIGNQGLHQIDVARWGLGVKYPTKVSAIGGHFMFDDDQETPNTITATFEFDDNGKKKMLVADVRHWMSNKEAGLGQNSGDSNSIGDMFYGSKGYLVVENSGEYYTFLGRDQKPGPAKKQSGNHWANFIDAVRSRKVEDLHAPIEEGALSTTLVHLANISYRLGRTLHFDGAAYKCVGDEEANKMFTRDYRAPFVVPKVV
jgi:predicted dehydrogenase